MRFAFASLLVLTTAAGCAAQTTDDTSSIEADESELRAACTLGAGCPDAIKVFAATTLQSVPRVEARDDVTVDFNGNPDWVTEPFATGTTRKLVNEGKGRVVLTGSADGTAPIVVDDFLLVEVLAESGQVLAKGTVNPGAGVLVDGAPPASLANGAPWGGPGKGWSYGQIDITSLLPAGKTPFRIRVSAFDITSFATTTDVYVKTVSSAPPPPPPPPPAVDLWSAASCAGPRINLAQAKARFQPGTLETNLGTLQMAARKRACNDVTGCGAWQDTDKLPYSFTQSTPQYGALTSTSFLPLVAPGDASRVWYAAKTSSSSTERDPIHMRVSYLRAGKEEGLDLHLTYDLRDGSYTDSTYTPSAAGSCVGGLGCPRNYRVYGGHLRASVRDGLVTQSCMRFVVKHTERANRSTQYTEFETVFFSQF